MVKCFGFKECLCWQGGGECNMHGMEVRILSFVVDCVYCHKRQLFVIEA